MGHRLPPPGEPVERTQPINRTEPLPVEPFGAPTGPLPPASRRPPQGPLLALAILALLAILLAVLVAGRSRHTAAPATATPVVAAAQAIDVANGALLVAPNPVAAGVGKGAAVVSWITPDGAVGQVWVSTDGQPEVLFAQAASGAQYATFIETGKRYEFRLYQGTAHTGAPVKRVVVTRGT